MDSHKESPGGLIAAIQADSIASQQGWQPGDRLVALNGHVLRDVIDYRFYQADEEVTVLLERGGRQSSVAIRKDPDEDLGVQFAEGLFDRLSTCRNDCPFCFLKGLPRGLRRTLYLKDDDYRYSFLFGNFVTLTNLSETDWERIAEQCLSPLYVSVHATVPAARRFLLGNPQAPDVLPQLRRLGSLGIQVHTQIVLVPAHNTGTVLTQTVSELASLYPAVQSRGIVPVGLTSASRNLRGVTVGEAREIADRHRVWHGECRRKTGQGLVYLADELFLRGGLPVPGARYYDGFPQLENGIGLVRGLLDDWSRLKRRLRLRQLSLSPLRLTLLCGTLAAPVLQQIAEEWNSLLPAQCRVIPVESGLFGPSVTVSGLLTAGDIAAALQGQPPGDLVILPCVMFDAGGRITLDDSTPVMLEKVVGVPIAMAGNMSDIARLLAR